MPEEPRVRITPATCVSHDKERYSIEAELPGVKKKNVEVQATQHSLCITGRRGDIEYSTCYQLAHAIDVDKTSADYKDGFLNITLPFREAIKTVEVKIN
ncbi:MAG: Hsp20/alpha crystallin family protein [Promethearchaeota archaeon]